MKKIIYLLAATLSISAGFAQKSTKEVKGDAHYAYYFFDEAIQKYTQAESLTTEGSRRLAHCYENTNQPVKAEEIYAKFIHNTDVNADDYYNYYSILKNNGKYDAADEWMEKFATTHPNDLRTKDYRVNHGHEKEMMQDEGRYKIAHLAINSAQEDFGAAFYNNQVVFASSRGGSPMIKRNYNWNHKPFLDLYVADVNADQLQSPRNLNKALNKKLHEGPASFSADGKWMAFTRNNYENKSKDGVVKLQIFFSEFKNGKWSNAVPFKLNNSEYSVGHPCLSADGNTLYFVSDMPGGFGGSDLYRIQKNETGEWSDAQNLGERINTEGNEMFPFFQETSAILFFASNGHTGLGGLDVFVSPMTKDKSFGKTVNAGVPINTQYDDFALIIDPKMQKGYFSSNRVGGSGDDDLYSFDLLKPFVFGKIVKGSVKDKNGAIVAGAKVSIQDETGKEIGNALTGEDGSYSFVVEPDKNFVLNGSKEKYFDGRKHVDATGNESEINADVILEKDPGLSIYGMITEKESKAPIAGVQVKVVNILTGAEDNFVTDNSGEFTKVLAGIKLNDKLTYNITLNKDGYLSKSLMYTKTVDREGRYDLLQEMDLSLEKVGIGTDLAKIINIKPIYFDLGKFNIRKDATAELDKIVKVMNENPTMVIELGSHTDCRSSAASNEKLSDKRAKASAEYIRKKITNPERISGKGYGESKLKNGCACEGAVKSTCTEQEHQENRRTEFIIIKM